MKSQQTKSRSRNATILNYRKTHTLKETAQKYNLTSERIRQIAFIIHQKTCSIHNRKYYNKCSHCLVEKYKQYLKWCDYKTILSEAKKESKNRKRDYLSVQRRMFLIKIMYDKYHLKFMTIAVMLKRDLSTIKFLYKK